MKPYRLMGVAVLDGETHVDAGDNFGDRLEDGFDAVFSAVLSLFSPIHFTLWG